MEKPGSGTPAPRPLIIERPDLQSRSQRIISTTLTAIFWALWLYLWLPAVALVGWWLGVTRFYEEMVRLEGYKPLVELLGWYALCIGALAGSLICWAVYNLVRFRGRERRKARPLVRVAQVAEHVGVEAETLLDWQRARILHVLHDESGRIESVETLAVPSGAPAVADSEDSEDSGDSEDAGPETMMRDPALA